MKHINEYEIYDERQKKAIELVKTNMDNWLCLYGKSGTGKDAISDLIALQKRRQGKKIFKTSAFMLLQNFKCYFLESVTMIEEIVANDLVIINEIEKIWKGSAGNEKELIFEIINRLYDGGKQLIIISNLTWVELQKEGIITNAVADRFAEKGIGIEFNWESYRQRGGKK